MARQGQHFRREKRGNAAGQSALALLFGSYVDGLGRGAVFLCDVDAGCPWRSKVVMGASVHQSGDAAGRGKLLTGKNTHCL